MMPSLFVACRAPMQVKESSSFLRELTGRLPARPRGIVLFSAFWENRVQLVSGAVRYEAAHDASGLEKRLVYPAQGDVTLSLAVQELLREEGIPCETDDRCALDAGWMPLLAMFPLADVPVVAMSVHPGLAAEEQYRIGRALAPLRERNVLIVGSGGMSGIGSGSGNKSESGSCNGNKIGSGSCSASKPASGGGKVKGCGDAGIPFEFEEWLGEQLETWNTEALFDYERRAPCVWEPVPPAFMAPLLRAMGAADRDGEAERLIIDGLDSETERLIFDGLDSETEQLIFDDEAELLHCDGLDSEEERLIFDGLDSLGVSGAPLTCWRFGGSETAG